MSEQIPARFSTGNKFVSLPDFRTADCALETLSFLHGGLRAAIELHGCDAEPFLAPYLTVDGSQVEFKGAEWEQMSHWVPRFRLKTAELEVTGTLFAPLEHKGVTWVLEIRSLVSRPLELSAGWRGCWQDTYHVANLSKPMIGTVHGGFSDRCESACFIEFRYAAPMFAISFCSGEAMKTEMTGGPDAPVRYSLTKDLTLGPGQSVSMALNVGVGLEETSAVMSAVDSNRHGWRFMLDKLMGWLEQRTYHVDDEHLSRVINLNSFYANFYSQGITIDTERLVLVSSRSSRYPGSAAYKDRDAMLWSLPAVLQIDPGQARRMLEYAFTVQLRNVGLHSRFMDGVVLEPGFELDELCAPARGLWMYVSQTGDMSIVFDRRVQTGLNRIQQLLASARNPGVGLYETMLTPSGEVARHPFLTYGNVLVWRMLRDVAAIYERIRDLDRTQETLDLARAVRKAVMSRCIVEGPFEEMFAWSVNESGSFELNDDPAGSLQLLAWLEFCAPDLPAYRNTVEWIHSKHNARSFAGSPFGAPSSPGAEHPSVLALANELMSGRKDEALEIVRRVWMDDLIASESIDETTGGAASGLAFAAGSGYLAYALTHALGVRTASAPVMARDASGVERLSPVMPEVRDSVDL